MSYKSILLKHVSVSEIEEISKNDKSINFNTENLSDNEENNIINKKNKTYKTDKINNMNKNTKLNKNFKRKNSFSNNSKEKFNALLEAQKKFIRLCKPNKEDEDEINTGLQFINNWNGKNITIDASNDILIKKNGKKYTFSKVQFLKNKKFKELLIKELSDNFNCDMYVKIFKKNKMDTDNEYIINVNKSKK